MHVLSLVTGGANGLGEHMRSLNKEEIYTPNASMQRRLRQVNAGYVLWLGEHTRIRHLGVQRKSDWGA